MSRASDRESTLCHLDFVEWLPADFIAKRQGITKRGMEATLNRYFAQGHVERKRESMSHGGFRFVWRRAPIFTATGPLYPPVPGWDAGMLASCWLGYTYDTVNYLQRKETSWQA